MNKQLCFMLYDSRSGSTLLASMLNQYDKISVSLESGYVSRIIGLTKNLNEMNSSEIIDFLSEEPQFRELKLNTLLLAEIIDETLPHLSKVKLINIIIDECFKDEDDSTIWVVKHAPYVYLSEVINLFPNVKFIQIIRDGRAVFNSKKKTLALSGKLMENNPIKAALDWKFKLRKSEKYSQFIVNVRYEELLEKKEEEIKRIINKVTTYGDNKLTKSNRREDYYSNIGVNQKKIHINLTKSPQTANAIKWKKELNNVDIFIYELFNKKTLLKYGYELNRPKVQGFKTVKKLTYYSFNLFAYRLVNILSLLNNPNDLKNKIYKIYSMMFNK